MIREGIPTYQNCGIEVVEGRNNGEFKGCQMNWTATVGFKIYNNSCKRITERQRDWWNKCGWSGKRKVRAL